MEALQILITRLKEMAFVEAAEDIINRSAYTIPAPELKRMAHKASRAYPEFLKAWKIKKQEVKKPASPKSPEEMVVSVYFNIDRKALKDAKKRYARLDRAMTRAESKMAPVLVQFRDYMLYLKHNLNAQAIGALQNEVKSMEIEVEALIGDMGRSIKEADEFLKNFS